MKRIILISILAVFFFQISVVFDYTHITMDHENTCEKCELIGQIIENINKLILFMNNVIVYLYVKYVLVNKIIEIKSLGTLVLMKVQANE